MRSGSGSRHQLDIKSVGPPPFRPRLPPRLLLGRKPQILALFRSLILGLVDRALDLVLELVAGPDRAARLRLCDLGLGADLVALRVGNVGRRLVGEELCF